jgi:hypothetical protein
VSAHAGSNGKPATVVVIPCLDGAATIGEVVRGARACSLPVIVVDDGSSDGSGALAEAAGATVLRHAANQGKGAALASGFACAARLGAAAVLTMDADGQHDPAEIPALLAAHAADASALVLGVRSFDPAAMPRRSRIGNRISTWWISRFAGRRYRDTQSGFRIYPRALYAEVKLISKRFDTETELLLRAAKMGLPLVEVPIRTIYGPNRVTHFHGFTDTLRVIKLVLGSPLWALALLLVACAGGGGGFGPVRGDRGAKRTSASGAEEVSSRGETKAPVQPNTTSWKTMRAEHEVAIDVKLGSGQHDKRTLRGLIAIERPDRFRLRALGPGGITLFDVMSVHGEVTVLQALRDPNSPALARIIESMAGDLDAAYDLAPRPPGRSVGRVGDEVVVQEPGRTVRETAERIEIDNAAMQYKVSVRVRAVETNVPLDPKMFVK